MDSQAAGIVKWAEQQAKPACKPAYKRLTDNDRILARQLRDKGKTQAEIAQVLGCSQQAVSDWLRKLEDTKYDASLYLAGSALRMAQNIVKNGLPRDHIQALKGIGVADNQAGHGLVIQIGIKDSDVTFACSTQQLSSDMHKLSDETGSDNS